MRIGWNMECHFHVSPFFEGMLLFEFPSETAKNRALEKGPWLLAGLILALESWRSNFHPGKDSVRFPHIWVHLPDLLLKFWETKKILKLVSEASISLFVDDLTATSARMGFAKVSVIIDITRPPCSGAKV